MNFKPGDKVWFDCRDGAFPDGTYPAIAIRDMDVDGWWAIEVEGYAFERWAHRTALRPRFDPPPQQEPKQQREPTGEWELCPWRPSTTEIV